ncbi:hypothetical protein H9185_001150 [Listeria monocytogenes]|nr:hypothetical protein [Listeria monocytogenes]
MEMQNIIIAVILSVIIIGGGIYVNGFKNWLVWAVSEAEAMFGSKTGKLKLRYAYELAVIRFPAIAKFIPFALFSKLVDSALKIMRKMIEENKHIADAIMDELAESVAE